MRSITLFDDIRVLRKRRRIVYDYPDEIPKLNPELAVQEKKSISKIPELAVQQKKSISKIPSQENASIANSSSIPISSDKSGGKINGTVSPVTLRHRSSNKE